MRLFVFYDGLRWREREPTGSLCLCLADIAEIFLDGVGEAGFARRLHRIRFTESQGIRLPGLYDQLETQVQRVFAENDFYIAAVLNSDLIVWRVKHSDTEWFRTMQNAVEMGLSGWVADT
jgi:hypothetical protein